MVLAKMYVLLLKKLGTWFDSSGLQVDYLKQSDCRSYPFDQPNSVAYLVDLTHHYIRVHSSFRNMLHIKFYMNYILFSESPIETYVA